MTARRVLVVARYEEDVGWLQDRPEGWDAAVVQKGRDLPNVGREASSYLWWIARELADLEPDDRVTFLQGRPWDHGFRWEDLGGEVRGYTPHGGRLLEDDGTGAPNHHHLPLDELYRAWGFGEPLGRYRFVAGAQFSVRGADLLSLHVSRYLDLRERVENNELGPWAFERFWPHLWRG